MSIDNTTSSDFFDTYSGSGGGGAPSFAFRQKGDTVKGVVKALKQMDQTHFSGIDAGKPIPDPKRPGQNKKQLAVTLETKLRNWEGVTSTPTDADGNQLPASEDTGARAIYVKGWMIGAIADAVSAATGGERRGLYVGDTIAVQLVEAHDAARQNPKKYRANVKPAPVGADLFEQAEAEQTAASVKATEADNDALDLGDEDEVKVPF